MADEESCYNTIYQDLIDLIGYENALKIYDRYNGQQLSLPKRLYSKEYVEKKVVEEYNGKNIKQLAQKYLYTERWVSGKVKDKKF
ncbi:Mor transcription activator family protein [Ruminococcus sp.]|uniref:Mor transcription activator family protein n=1 Tax=Ruminococcus sp. TaxID=41978 RepID=UPI0025CEEAB9|nr:Mor transcription activator family protein [Ruminococcus sp.]